MRICVCLRDLYSLRKQALTEKATNTLPYGSRYVAMYNARTDQCDVLDKYKYVSSLFKSLHKIEERDV